MTHKIRSLLFCAAWLALPFFYISPAAGAKEKEAESTVKASIRPSGKPKKAELPALAKLSFEDALNAARAATPGSVLKAELEIEHGGLMYSFDIVTAEKKVVEVEIDAGDGKVLSIDKD